MENSKLLLLEQLKAKREELDKLYLELEFSLKCEDIIKNNPNFEIIQVKYDNYLIKLGKDKNKPLTQYLTKLIIAKSQNKTDLINFYRDYGTAKEYDLEFLNEIKILSIEKVDK